LALAQGGGNSILREVATQLENFSDEDNEDGNDDSVHCAQLVHLYLSDCPNVMTTMKSMVSRFIDASVEGKPFNLLCPYTADINALRTDKTKSHHISGKL
jgi:hypothetical protein